MLTQITFFPIFGKPLIMYGGILTLLCMFFTAVIPSLQKKWPSHFNFRLHVIMARITIVLALFHGFLGMMIYF
jgi:hypothetical protein